MCSSDLTMRSKTEYVIVENEKGRQEPRKIGLAPIQREGMDYEFTTVFDITQNHIATASKDRTNLFHDDFFTLSELTGQKLKDWLETGYEVDARKRQQQILWLRYLNVFNQDAKQAADAMKNVTGKTSFMDCTEADIQALISDIEKKEQLSD